VQPWPNCSRRRAGQPKGPAGTIPEIDFYPGGALEDGPNLHAHKDAVAVCQTCPVRADCLEAGMAERHGIWGGTTERERVRLRAARRGSAA